MSPQNLKAILFFVCLNLIACAREPVCEKLATGHKPERLVAFGDSQTAGHGTESSPNCGFSWANIISQRRDLTLVNLATAGAEWVGRFSQFRTAMAFKYESTDQVVILLGLNDMVNHGEDPVHLADFKAKLVDWLLTASPQVRSITIGLTPYSPYDRFSATDAATLLYRQTILDVVASLNLPNVVTFIPDDSFAHDLDYFTVDQWHFTVEAQTIIADQAEGVML